jgi:hypothetical protein
MGLLLFGVTWKLWTPQSQFPQIPFFEFLCETPRLADWMGSVVVAVALIGLLFVTDKSWTNRLLSVFAIASIGLVLLNQHRLQPWTYQFIVFAIIMATCSQRRAFRLMRWITVSIYCYSAFSKFDYQFVHTQGQGFLTTLAGFTGQDLAAWDATTLKGLVLLLPTGELLAGVALLLPATRRWGLVAIVLMHIALVLILGPWGLDHQPGVLTWNLYLIGNAVFLFGGDAIRGTGDSATWPRLPFGWSEIVGILVAAIVLVFPLTVSIDICDHWPGWEVYAPRSSRASLTILAEDPAIPQNLQPFLESQGMQAEFSPMKWSLATLGVPIYPEDRFQFGVIAALVEKSELRWFEIELGRISNRLQGQRKIEKSNRKTDIPMWRDRFWLNTKAREF